MACTTILVGKKASYDGSTIIARNDDSPTGVFTAKKMLVKERDQMPKKYRSKISHVEVELPEHSYRYTYMPNVDDYEGIWGASGINEHNVAMTATETITSNPRVLGADPLVSYQPKTKKNKEVKGGIGEEDLVVLVLPYITSAKEGVLRLGALLEKYGTYESNGIAFSDEDSIWWLETIGGHHFIARRVPDDRYVVMPNQFGLDHFDFGDAYGEQKEFICSKDLKEFMEKNHLDLGLQGEFNPRLAFGSHDDSDHTYNTPRAWYMGRYFNPNTYKWEGENADYTPESDNIPWSFVPERKITIEDVKYALSSHYQGTAYDPYSKLAGKDFKPLYRPIGISRTSFLHISQIRPYTKKENAAIEWVAFASNVFNTLIPVYTNVKTLPKYLSNTTLKVSTDNFYWASRLLSALVDPHFQTSIIHIERYQDKTMAKSYEILHRVDEEFEKTGDMSLLHKGNEELAVMMQEETDQVLSKVLYQVSCQMKNGFARSDN